MKQKYLFFIFFGVFFLLILFALVFIKKSTAPLQKNSQELKTQQTVSQFQYQQSTSSRNYNNQTQQPPNSYLTPTKKPSLSILPFNNIANLRGGPGLVKNDATPTPTKTPLSAFSSALNNIYGKPVDQTVAPAPQRPKTSPTPTPDSMKSFINALDALFSGFSNSKADMSTSITDESGQQLPDQSTKTLLQSQEVPIDKVYYSQCNGEYDNYPLPGGCTICKAGCGPTSISMILSSYIDKKFTPSGVVDLYKQSGLELGCKGSTVGDAQQILEQNGMKTTDLLYYGETPTQEVINDLKSYLQYGWTMFMLAKFCPKGCGHFFWIVDIDNNNNVWTYDPGYGNIDGKKIVPLNESSLNPPAHYYVAFGVKKQ
jgi:hypothetical protein